ncbi:VCBS repeat-containing protein [Telluribacter sp. SYSU D00476]|uniref:VCBS repeat-containing protein n=1 Tax=Telluribacter sp. SYSU D00476 TaxID=2811430 RepID=UPI001FF18657|nr:VCBS repeat-containing protein [Telluribacter sp. SYSU D00476]
MRTSSYLVVALATLLSACSQKAPTLFERLDASDTGVTFENRLQESEQWNILAYEYYYNGGGVAVGDFNNDSLPDIYFTGNQVPNKLYLNKGDFIFEDVTEKAGVAGRTDGWATGVTVADVNADGYLDLYVCYSGPLAADKRKNQLFINNGNLTFTERAEEYGVAESGYSTQAAFLDYDRDGDLDLYVMNHNLRNYGRKEAAFLKASRDPNAGDKLYRNEGGKFIEVGEQAGISSNPLGFGLGLAVADLNQDGWPDLYVGNDYVEEDYVYLNNRNGKFEERGKQMMGHYSFSTMGCDIADVNNDARPDVFTMDMLPADNARQKLLAWPDSWSVQLSMLENGFHWQNMRNMLHVNVGTDANGLPKFSEVGQLAGVSNTDWSWGSLFADFDNDGYKDMFVSNGYVRDYTNQDFIKYYADEKMRADGNGSLLKHLEKMPSTPTHNYIFRNEGNLSFADKVTDWGFDRTTIASGSAYADLDGDGDLDLITNNTNESAGIFRNHQQEREPRAFLKVAFKSAPPLGATALGVTTLGVKALVYTGGSVQMQEYYTTRGFQSSSAGPLHFGLGKATGVDSVRVVWPDGQSQLLKEVKVNQTLYLDKANAAPYTNGPAPYSAPLLEEVAAPAFTHRENFVIDFNRQLLLPRQYSYEGPRLTKADVNGDGLEDFFVGGAMGQSGAIFLKRTDNSFQLLRQPDLQSDSTYEDRAAVFLDADGDGDQDLYVVSGAYEMQPSDAAQEDRLYLNDGRGNFTKAPIGYLPGIRRSGSCVAALDADKDGDVDLFIGGGVSPGEFPYAAESFLLVNDGRGHFTVASDPLPVLGMLTDVGVADINRDGWPDLVVVGEWMPITYFLNQKGKFDFKQKQVVEGSEGLWLRLAGADLDKDGDIDFVVGNWGLNNPFKPSAAEPVTLYANDFDRNGTLDPFISYYIQGKEYPLASRDEALEQLLPLRKRFTDYATYAKATLGEVLSEVELKSAEIRKVVELQTSLLMNESGKLVLKPLPRLVQQAPVSAIAIDDFNQDGHLDLLLAGNLSKTRIRIGKMDASYGKVLLGDGKQGFISAGMDEAGISIPGDTKDILRVGDQWLVARNDAPLLLLRKKKRTLPDMPLTVNK